MTWLVTGGAGYIGAHIVRCLTESGRPVVVLDDLSSGHRDFVPDDVPFVEGSVADTQAVRAALELAASDSGPATGVVHLAGFKYAGVSVAEPLRTYADNVIGTQVLLDQVVAVGVPSVVFSSSAAVYGTPDVDQVTERTPPAPQSPYGESKLIGEWLLRDVGRAHGISHTSLRYFNVVGSGYAQVYDSSPHNLFPLVLQALAQGRQPVVYGTDYPTPDGSCVRDYVHVHDVALAHVAAVAIVEQGAELEPVYNLGSGQGASVLQIMDAVRRVTGMDVQPQLEPRRPGDPARIVADGALAARDLDWAMRHTLDDMVATAWKAAR